METGAVRNKKRAVATFFLKKNFQILLLHYQGVYQPGKPGEPGNNRELSLTVKKPGKTREFSFGTGKRG